jgi:hypothetical protein
MEHMVVIANRDIVERNSLLSTHPQSGKWTHPSSAFGASNCIHVVAGALPPAFYTEQHYLNRHIRVMIDLLNATQGHLDELSQK